MAKRSNSGHFHSQPVRLHPAGGLFCAVRRDSAGCASTVPFCLDGLSHGSSIRQPDNDSSHLASFGDDILVLGLAVDIPFIKMTTSPNEVFGFC